MKHQMLNLFRIALVSIAALIPFDRTLADSYPTRAITIVVSFPPGGVADIVARAVAAKAQKSLGQPLVVENKPGAGGTLGASLVARAPADGHTILLASSFLSTAPSMYKDLTWHPLRSFTPISLVAEIPSVIVTNPSVRADTLKEFINHAKRHPKSINYASGGHGTVIHLGMELLQQMTDITLTHVPYKGQPDALRALLRGDVSVMLLTVALAKARIASREVEPLAVTSGKRSSALPNIPTVAESGYAKYEATTWFGFSAPAATPSGIINTLNSAIVAAVKDEETTKRLHDLGADILADSPEHFATFMKADVERWSTVIQRAGMAVEK